MADVAPTSIVQGPGFITVTLTGPGADHGPIPLRNTNNPNRSIGRTITARSTVGTGAVNTGVTVLGRLNTQDATATMRMAVIDRLKGVAATPNGAAWATAVLAVAVPVQAVLGADYSELWVTVTGGAADALVILTISD